MKKQGMAIPLVLIFATILGLISTFLLKSARNYNRSNLTSQAQLQSYFLARAGVEHAMLKIKYLHRELYDAICMSQGRNPLFDFTLIQENQPVSSAIKQYNPGPIFLYKEGQYTPLPNSVYTQNFGNHPNKDQWLEAFTNDLTSNPTQGQKGNTVNQILDVSKSIPNDIKALMKEPFTGAYGVTKLNIAASENKENTSKVENNAIVELTIYSTVTTARDENLEYQIKKTIKISRD